MNTLPKVALLLLTLTIGLLATGCPQRRSIADIEANPGRYQNKEVIITGVVRDSYGISLPGTRVGGGAYKIDDGTGSIWVFTERGVPARGTEIGIRGVVGSGVNWKGKTYGLGLYEKQRKYKRR
ncbi:MAG: hypothetical protein ABJA02_07670 [Acidobacteriota bacterium]